MTTFNAFLKELERPVLDEAPGPADEAGRLAAAEAALAVDRKAGEDTAARLTALEAALVVHKAGMRREELSHFAFRECTAAGLDVALLDGFTMADEAAVSAKVAQLANAAAVSKIAIKNAVLASGYKPGAGVGHEGSGNLATMSPETVLAHEMNGSLNKLLTARGGK